MVLVCKVNAQDTVVLPDSVLESRGLTVINDSIPEKTSKKSSVIDSPIDYNASDSIAISMEDGQQIVHLYGSAKVKYGTVELTAAYIKVNFEQKEIYAEGIEDSTGTINGKPHFMEGTEEFDCATLRYNFVTGKGYSENVITKQQDGTVHGAKAKMINKEVYCMEDGMYSTCDADHPHFYLNMTKGKVIKDKAIITGRAYMVLEDFPIYFPFLPYGFLPTFKKTYTSGVIIPSYGSDQYDGYYLKNGGFYWAASDFFDIKVTGDAYTSGKWALNGTSSYRLRYKFSGSFSLGYSQTVNGTRGIDYSKNPNFNIVWSHNQDVKANPSQTFSASVNFSSSGWSRENEYEDPTKAVTNSKSSTISYRKTFLNTPFSLSASVRANQNTRNQTVDLQLPSLTLNMKSIQPFKPKKRSGPKRFYEDFKLSYSLQTDNKLTTTESELFTTPFSEWRKGIKHNLPITLPSFKLLNHINVVPSFSYNERWYFDYQEKYWLDGYYAIDNETGLQKWIAGRVEEVRRDGFKRNYEYSYSLSASTTLYGMYEMINPNWKVKKIQHKIDPSISFNYHPDFAERRFGFYEMVQVDSMGRMERYNIFQKGIYGSTSAGKSGAINFSLANRVEMKIRNDKDSVATDKKVPIIDNFGVSSSYNLRADSMKLSPFSLNLRTKVAGTSINISGSLNPYQLNEKAVAIDKYTWNDPNRSGMAKLGRLTNVSTGFNLSYSSDKLKSNKKGNKVQNTGQQQQDEEEEVTKSTTYAEYKMPWRISMNYTFSYSNPNGTARWVQSVGINGGVDFTTKWKSTFSSGYDFIAGKITHTNVSITRDLHCWAMSFNFSPIGTMKYYTFSISANAAMLKDLRLQREERSRSGY